MGPEKCACGAKPVTFIARARRNAKGEAVVKIVRFCAKCAPPQVKP